VGETLSNKDGLMSNVGDSIIYDVDIVGAAMEACCISNRKLF